MTRKTSSRIAGVTFLLYIAIGVSSMVLSPDGDGIAAKLEAMAQHDMKVRIGFLLGLLMSFCALVLAVTLHGITREEDADLAMLGMICRAGEGLVGISIPVSLSLLWLATSAGPDAPEAQAAHALAAFALKIGGWQTLVCALLFAVGSTIFSYLFLRGRIVPLPMAWLGLVASILLVICLPAQLAGFFTGSATQLVWIPMAVFEVVLALWLIIKGANPSQRGTAANGSLMA
jgi:hypothetical protein